MTTIKIRHLFVALALSALIVTLADGQAQPERQESNAELAAPVEPLPPDINEALLFTELMAHNQLRNTALLAYTEDRTYAVTDLTGRVRAQESGQMEYRAPDKKTFAATSESGSMIVRRLALNPLIASEITAASAKQHRDSAITPANYTLELLGQQQVGPYRCIVARATPKRPDKYLFEGKIWIDAHDFAVVRIEGHPAQKLSFWIERVNFVREYQKIDGFWLSQKDETFVQVRMYGQKILTIDHRNYAITGASEAEASVQNAGS
jgi:hypothetical protein